MTTVRRLSLIASTTTSSLLVFTGKVIAGPESGTSSGVAQPGVRIGEWIYTNVAALFAPLLAVMAIYFLAKRQFTEFLSFAAFAVIAALFVFGGAEFKDAAVGLVKWVIGR